VEPIVGGRFHNPGNETERPTVDSNMKVWNIAATSSRRFEMPDKQFHARHVLLMMIAFSLGWSMSWRRRQPSARRPLQKRRSEPSWGRLDDPATRDPSDVQAISTETFYTVMANGNMLSKGSGLRFDLVSECGTVKWATMRFFEYGNEQDE
jgi:hypothetical protein